MELEEVNKKRIDVIIKSGASHVNIQIINPCIVDTHQSAGYLTTKKENKKNHGYGLKNVIETVKKNNGDISLISKNGFFIAKVTLSVK